MVKYGEESSEIVYFVSFLLGMADFGFKWMNFLKIDQNTENVHKWMKYIALEKLEKYKFFTKNAEFGPKSSQRLFMSWKFTLKNLQLVMVYGALS